METKKPFVNHVTINPGDFPIGSKQSRAAARALLQAKKKEEEEATVEYQVDFGDGLQIWHIIPMHSRKGNQSR